MLSHMISISSLSLLLFFSRPHLTLVVRKGGGGAGCGNDPCTGGAGGSNGAAGGSTVTNTGGADGATARGVAGTIAGAPGGGQSRTLGLTSSQLAEGLSATSDSAMCVSAHLSCSLFDFSSLRCAIFLSGMMFCCSSSALFSPFLFLQRWLHHPLLLQLPILRRLVIGSLVSNPYPHGDFSFLPYKHMALIFLTSTEVDTNRSIDNKVSRTSTPYFLAPIFSGTKHTLLGK
jgi:hypothetical protein